MPNVYLVEDDENIRELVLYALKTEDFSTRGFESGADFRLALTGGLPDLVLLDIMLPGEDGISILKWLRQNGQTAELPVIMLTAKGSEYDRVKGLDLGADDYIVKPFSMLELISRIRAVLRRGATNPAETEFLQYENLSLDSEKHVVLAGGNPVPLTFKEFELLHYLLQNRDIVLSREKIMNRVWGFDFEGESRTVDMHIKTLRQKLGPEGALIKTVRSVGYKLGK